VSSLGIVVQQLPTVGTPPCLCRGSLPHNNLVLKVKLILLQTVGQSVLLSGTHLWSMTRFYYCQTVVGLLMWGASSDEKMGVVYSCCWASPTKSLLGPSPTQFITIFYCLRFETPSNLKGQVPMFISPRNRVANLTFRCWIPFLSPLDGYGWGILSTSTPGPQAPEAEVKLQLTVSWPAYLGVRHPSGAHDQIYIYIYKYKNKHTHKN
jgi:hypothetical protein